MINCQLEILQTSINSFMMGLINHKQISKKLMKKCKIFDYLVKKFPLDSNQLESYSKNIAFNSTMDVERKFVQDNLLDLLIFNKCFSMDSSTVQLSNSGSTTLLDSSAECSSPYLLKHKNNSIITQQTIKDLTNQKDSASFAHPQKIKSYTNLQDQSCKNSGGLLSSSSEQNQLSSTVPASNVQSATKADINQQFPLSYVNQLYGLGNISSPHSNLYNLTSTTNNFTDGKKQPKLTVNTLQSPIDNPNFINTPHLAQNQRIQSLQSPNLVNTTAHLKQDDIKINQFNLGSNNKTQALASNIPSNNIHMNNKQTNNNFYLPMSIKPINFKMTVNNQKEYANNTFDTSLNGNTSNYQIPQQFSHTLYNIQSQDLMMKPVNTQIEEKVNTFNPSSLLSKVKDTISSFIENTQKINNQNSQTIVTEVHPTPYLLASLKNQSNVNNVYSNTTQKITNSNPNLNTNILVNNKPLIQQTPYQNNGYNMSPQADFKRKSYMLKNMSIYQQNNKAFRQLQA